MRILHATSELFPYSKTGGLADMVDGLSKALAAHNHEVGVVTPLYRGLKDRFGNWERLESPADLPLGPGRTQAVIWVQRPLPNLAVYFVDHPGLFDRPGIYQEGGRDYPDNAARFTFFSKCVTHLAQSLPFRPEIIHAHDWQTSLVPLFVKHLREGEGWTAAPRTLLTIHNMAFQGIFPASEYGLTNLSYRYFQPEGLEYYGQMNCLKAGIVYADGITTVSPTYAREITTSEFGCGLDGVLRKRQHVLQGILNGVDYSEWRTEGNPHLRHPYNLRQTMGKGLQKRILQKEMGLPQESRIPLFGAISRLSEQKGMDIELAALEETLFLPIQFVLLGSGAKFLEDAFSNLASRYPDKVAVRLGYDQPLSHRIEAGCDFFLMPSRFEPCGLNQMYSLRYGTVPIVRATGGLQDSIIDISEDLGEANGIKFQDYSSQALASAIRKALGLYGHPDLLRHYRSNGMKADFSWDRTSLQYVDAYQRILTASA